MDASQIRFITLFNFVGVPYSDDFILPPGREFQKVLIQDGTIKVFRGGDLGTVTSTLHLTESSFQEVFEESAMVIIHDCMFLRDSDLVTTAEFFDYGGMAALVGYFRNGGTIYVQCVEGIMGTTLSEKFGCRWELQDIGSEYVVATERGRQLFGEDTIATSPVWCKGEVHFMRCPKGEGIVAKRVYTKKEFIKEYEPDEDEVESDFLRYKQGAEGQFVICIYEGFRMEGKVIWNGDKGQNAVLKRTIEKLLAL
eukprot:jgi/Psemu1/304903/fgenesh1_kg.175_\